MKYAEFLFCEIGRNMKRYWKLNCIAIATVCILFFLCAIGLLAVYNLRALMIKWTDQYTLHVYFDQTIEKENILAVIEKIRSLPSVRKINYVSPKRTLEEFLSTFPGQADLVRKMAENPFPSALEVALVSKVYRPDEILNLSEKIKKMSGIADAAYDAGWSGDFYRLFGFLSTAGVGSGMILLILALCLVTFLYRLSFRERKHHAAVMAMVGADRSILLFPLWIEGTLYGVIGALAAVGLLRVSWSLFEIYGRSVRLLLSPWLDPRFFSSLWLGFFVLAGGFVGLLSSLAASREVKSVSVYH
ncbi:MAG: hypothetical protein HY391_01945 [Deltaproteobacteria bacterium]|nr:hypothetical protein [Deltaproteobacteria bacterium]